MAMLWQVSEEKNPILDHHRKISWDLQSIFYEKNNKAIEFSLALLTAFRSGRLAVVFDSSGGAPFYKINWWSFIARL